MTTNNASFSHLPITRERDHQPDAFASAWKKPETATPQETQPDLSGEVELDQARQAVQNRRTESEQLADLRTSITNTEGLKAEIIQLSAQLGQIKLNSGISETDSVANIEPIVHIQEKSRLQNMLGFLIKKPQVVNEFGMVNHRKNQLGGIIGAITGDQNKLMELNGNSASF